MTQELTKMLETCDINDKLHHDKKQIISYLSLLEKIYDSQKKDKFDQERIYRLTKAINSIKDNSNIKVSEFKLKESSENKEDKPQNVINDICEDDDEDKETNEIDDLLCYIEKELKLSGIDVNNINSNSFLSTNVKSKNSDTKPDINIDDNKSSDKISNDKSNQCDKSDIIIADTNLKNQSRLSKLFVKLEMKLKTFIQENSINSSSTKKLISGKDSKDIKDTNNKMTSINENVGNNKKTLRRPSQLPDLANSFFSNKKKVEALLNRAKKQRRISMIEFNARHFPENKKIEYIENSANKNIMNIKAVPCTEQIIRPKRKRRQKNNKDDNNKRISDFCEMVFNKEKNKEINCLNIFEDLPEIKEDSKVNENEDNNINNINKENPIFFDDVNDTSIKITSTINKNKIPNNSNILDKISKLNIPLKTKKDESNRLSKYNNEPSEFKIVIKPIDENEISYPSSDKFEFSSSVYDDDSEDDSNSYDSYEEKKEKLNKSLENSINSKDEEKSCESSCNKSKTKNVKRPSNFNTFFRKSIFSPCYSPGENCENDLKNKIVEDSGKSD